MSEYLGKQPLLSGVRAERGLFDYNWLDRFLWNQIRNAKVALRKFRRKDARLTDQIIALSEQYQPLDQQQLEQKLGEVRSLLRGQGLSESSIINAFALVREYSGRVLGMRHHSTQILASLCLLRGEVAEMATGEGKTLAATLACATAALAGVPVHVVTVNDYLATRDAEEMQPLYEALGLSLGSVHHELTPAERRVAYHCDITYCSNKELVFDYLKDRINLEGMASETALHRALYIDPDIDQQLLLRGLHFAIVDEADSIFVDEARTPLIISGEEKFGANEEQLITTAMELARSLDSGEDFIIKEDGGLQMNPQGKKRLRRMGDDLGGLWRSREYRESLVTQALVAYHRYSLDRDYIINDEGEVQIVDPYTGRVTPGRSWGQGLHQMIEMKEQVELTRPRETQAEISYQNFFRKYHSLAGMTGTALEVRREFRGVYRVNCNAIALLKKSLRQRSLVKVSDTLAQKRAVVSDWVGQLNAKGQPVLVGTATVDASEAVAENLRAAGLECKVLNARQDSEEAEIIAQAGQVGAITIATGMAGRGTDIKLSDEARELGGLHVVITELQDASRIDRQFFGRSARQGDPGSYSYILSLEDSLLERLLQPKIRALLVSLFGVRLWRNRAGYLLLRLCQQALERLHYQQRIRLLESDVKRQRLLSFSGKTDYS
jgi:preprotein translocase subunit SecA